MSGPAPAVAAVRVAVRRVLADEPLGSLVLVACSGGPDSLALAAGLAFEAPRVGLRAGAVVVDHGLQQGSDEVAAQAAAACRGLGLAPVLVVPVRVDGGGGPEAAARDARYAALEAVAAGTGAAAVLLGHTLDDQAESVLLGLARGSGPRSLSGMPPERGVFRRPLLGLTRGQTLAACAAQGLDPWHDPTNTPAEGGPLRSRVRGELMPVLEGVLGPGVVAALARTADLVREQADALDELAADLLTRAAAPRLAPAPPAPPAPPATSESSGVLAPELSDVAEGECTASEEVRRRALGSSDVAEREGKGEERGQGRDVAVLAAAPAGVRRAALRAAAIGAGSPPGALSRAHVLALDALVTDWHGQGPVPLPGGIEASRRYGRLFLHRPETRPDTKPGTSPGKGPETRR